MKKKLLILTMAALAVSVFMTACGSKDNVEVSENKAASENNIEEGTASAGEDSGEEENASDIVTIKDVYDANKIDDVLARHSCITIEYEAKEIATGDSLGQGIYQIEKDADNIEYCYDFSSMDNGGVKGQGRQEEGYIYNETESGDMNAFLIHPDEYAEYVQNEAYLMNYDLYNYDGESNASENDNLLVTAHIDVGEVKMNVDAETLEINTINYVYEEIEILYTVTYDNKKDLGVTVMDDALAAAGTAKVTVNFVKDNEKEQFNYNVPADTTVMVAGMELFDLFTDEALSDNGYIYEYKVKSNEAVILYAKYIL